MRAFVPFIAFVALAGAAHAQTVPEPKVVEPYWRPPVSFVGPPGDNAGYMFRQLIEVLIPACEARAAHGAAEQTARDRLFDQCLRDLTDNRAFVLIKNETVVCTIQEPGVPVGSACSAYFRETRARPHPETVSGSN